MTHSSIAAIVEEQVRRWQLEASRKDQSGEEVAKPIITISRQHGSGGVELARALAQKLGYSFWHKEILHEIANNRAMTERLLASFDEHRRNVIGELVGNLVLVNHSTSEYLRALAKVIHAIGTRGGAVIVGRGAQYLLDPDDLLRVRLVAPVEMRVQHMMGHGLTDHEARRSIENTDRDRAAFHKSLFHHDEADPSEYDLVLNLARIPVDRAVDVVLSAFRARFADRL